MSFELEIGKQLYWTEFDLLNFKGGLDDMVSWLLSVCVCVYCKDVI